MTERPSRPRHALRRVIAAVIAIAIGAAAGLVLYQASVQPGAAIVKAVFETGSEVTPPHGFAAIAATVVEKPRVGITVAGAPGARIDIYTPRNAPSKSLPVILWIHGGGFISSSSDTVRGYAIMLAHAGYVVASLDYTLAPGARHPVPVRQGDAALGFLAAHVAEFGGDPTRLFVGGDSAGAQIASELAAAETSPTLARSVGLGPAVRSGTLRGVVLFCGLYDMQTVGSTGFPALRTYLWAYTGSRNWMSSPGIDELSTTRQVTANYPPTFISVGDSDPFAPQAAELRSALRAKGVAVDPLFWTGTGDGLGHEYQFDFALPQANVAFDHTLAFLNANAKG